MFSFKQFLFEAIQTKPGNYVAVYVTPPMLPESLLPAEGKRPENNYHVTLIYSEFSNVNHDTINRICGDVDKGLIVDLIEAAVFDSIPKDGERDQNLATLVMKLKNDHIEKLHESLKSLGCVHSYPDYSPHVTVAYNVPREQAYESANKINMYLSEFGRLPPVVTTRFESKAIDKEWVAKL